MNILITGGAGYIGSHATKMLLDKGENIVVIDNLSTGYETAIDDRAIFYNEDIKDTKTIKKILLKERIDAVIHFAAFSIVSESMQKPLNYYDNNLTGTKNLLTAMVEAKTKYIVFSSTAAVYGDKDIMPITETMQESPENTYGETKLAMEKMMEWTSQAHDLNFISLRYFNVAGAHHSSTIGESHNPETHLIPLILQVPLEQREKIYIFGNDYDTKDGTCIRDYIHVEDLIEAHVLALKHLIKTNKNDYFNLGSGSGYSVLEMIKAARNVTGHPIPSEMAPRREGDPAKLIASSKKAEKILNWKRHYTTIESIIKSAWLFHQSHKEGFKK
ncbi:MAG: UDP-glucose 4-epimerase GalE [Candidatus Izimaplasma sp.]|nr:UDP-glucose 4-epimerase GalE [Candidatus Izimaplasma bacterium]